MPGEVLLQRPDVEHGHVVGLDPGQQLLVGDLGGAVLSEVGVAGQGTAAW
ncbi:hypothetical protein [Streptomyces sp. C8S0]|nr:hypothetical protein [Streptomyces sp. C8S0]